MNKNPGFISSVFILAVIAVLLFIFNIFENTVYAKCFVGLITAIFSTGVFYTVKSFSKLMATGLVFLLILLYFLFERAITSSSVSEIGAIIILTELFVIIFSYICTLVTGDKISFKYKKEVGKYLSDKILENIESSVCASDGGKRNLTVMFIDIRGFTSIAEKLSSTEVTDILNDYFKVVVPVITRYNGVVNKFIGDAILAVFDGEEPSFHAINAVKAGKAIIKRLRFYQSLREREGKPTFLSGIGINTGEVFIGSIGTEDRREYTVIGDTVNLANRTEAANRVYKTQFLITENTYKYVKEIADVIKISNVEMRGKKEKVNIYEVLRISEIDE